VLGVVEGRPADVIDVANLSLGYYHEAPDDAAADGPLWDLLADYGRWGVAVIAAAGNSSTTAPMFPAAFTLQPRDPGQVPLVSVGALNPDGSVAYFSNAGPWITCHRAGSNLVSTVPTTLRGAMQASARLTYDGRDRATIDPDDYRCGFSLWSGTSFAAPVFAGEVVAALADIGDLPVDRDALVQRTGTVVDRLLGDGR
jgi:subtilisin family serine protease